MVREDVLDTVMTPPRPSAARPTPRPGSEPAVCVRGLVKRYQNGPEANKGIDLDVRAGEVVAILGPNGAGKTTFLRQVTTELRPTAGTISVLGLDVISDPQRAKRLMGITPQEAGLFESLTVRQHVELFGRLKGLSKAAAMADARILIAKLGLTPETDHRVGKLSGGQKRRILIGLALVGNPPVLVLDEPTTGLDPASRRAVWELLRQVAGDGAAVILSTHYMEEAERLSDRIAIIQEGRLIAFGSLTELLGHVRESYRVTCRNSERPDGAMRVHRFATFGEAQRHLQRSSVSDYSIHRASLEDVYFQLVGQPFPEDAAEVTA
jgi:ABC-2 type transport system ATP-binding protein